MARVCVVRCHYFRDTRLQREVAALLDRGHRVHVLCLRGAGEPLRERRDHLTITRIPLSHAAGAGPARRLVEYGLFFLTATLGVTALHLCRRLDLVQVNSLPDALVFAALVPRLCGARVLLDLQEPMPEFFETKSSAGERHSAVRLIIALEQASIRFADAVLTATEQMRQAFVARGAPADKITVVMDGSDEAIFDPARHPGHHGDKFVLVSHGTIEPQYGLDTAIRAVAQLAGTIPALELRIIGDGSARTELQALASRLGVSDRVFFSAGFVPADELVTTLAGSDVGVVAMKQDRFRDLTLAGKMFDYITMGIPMVVSSTRSVVETFPDGCFETFVSDDAVDLARAIRRLHADPPLAASYARQAKDVARPYSWPVQRRHYWDVVDALLEPGAVRTWRGASPHDGTAPLSVTVTRRPDIPRLIRWDELVRHTPGSDVAQLSEWADVRRAAGFAPVYVFVSQGGELVGGAQVLTRRLPIVGGVGYLPYGPVIASGVDRDVVIAVLASSMRRLTRKHVRMLFIQPPSGSEDVSRELGRCGFRPTRADIAPHASLRLDLSCDERQLWAGLPAETRRRAKKWPGRAVRVRHGTQEDVAVLARLHAATAQHHGFEPISLEYMANLYRLLAPAGHVELFIGEIAGRPVVADLLTGCGGVLTGRLTGMDRESAAGKFGVPAAVRWEAIRWAKAQGYHWFDFGGVGEAAVSTRTAERPNSSMLTGGDAYKASFGATLFGYPPPVEFISSPLLRFAYDLARRWPTGRRMMENAQRRLRTGRRLAGAGRVRRNSGTGGRLPAR
jgi:glycosyltransferase involved in cell wall biosynthesis/lipid II:glycine glycyltransferase (peptidoglycan interpeptide bridge formation enzyme)